MFVIVNCFKWWFVEVVYEILFVNFWICRLISDCVFWMIYVLKSLLLVYKLFKFVIEVKCCDDNFKKGKCLWLDDREIVGYEKVYCFGVSIWGSFG